MSKSSCYSKQFFFENNNACKREYHRMYSLCVCVCVCVCLCVCDPTTAFPLVVDRDALVTVIHFCGGNFSL